MITPRKALWLSLAIGALCSVQSVSAEVIAYYDNKDTNWSKVCAYTWSGSTEHLGKWPGKEMDRVNDNSTIYKIVINDDNVQNIIFNLGSDTGKTGNLTFHDGHVYTNSGDTGKTLAEYINNPNPDPDPDPDPDPNPDPNPDAVYWTVPVKPSQSEAVTIYFNTSKASTLKDTSDVYLYSGAIDGTKDNNGKLVWSGTPSDWDFSKIDPQPFKMQQVEGNEGVVSITLTPSIEAFYNCSDKSIKQLGLIFRKKEGGKEFSDDKYLEVTPKIVTPSAGPLGDYVSFVNADGKVTVTATKGTLEITPMGTDIVRVFTRPNGNTESERASLGVDPDFGNPTVTYNVTSDDENLTIQIENGTRIVMANKGCLLSFYDNRGETPLLVEKEGLQNKKGNVSVTFMGTGNEAFYGGGWNGFTSNLDGRTLVMTNQQQGGNWEYGAEVPRNINIPVFISTKGYGVYFDSQHNNAKMKPSADGSSYTSSSPTPISYYYLGGGSMEKAIRNYVTLSGKQQLPPFWAWGYISSKYSFYSREEAEGVISDTRNAGMPLDAIVFDIDWQGGVKQMGRIDWGDRYSKPSEMMSNFRNQGVKTIAITEPFFTNNSGNYDALKTKGYLADESVSNMAWLNSSAVGLIDATNPDALDWMWQECYKPRTSEGIEGWWLDLGEPESHDGDSHHKGGSYDQVHNEFSNLWTARVYKGMRADFPDKRAFIMPRSGCAGMQRYSAFPWTGDVRRSWGGLKGQIPALINSSMSGVAYLGSDIGGFIANGTDPNLYERWVELGVFSPMMRTHSANNPQPYLDCYRSQRDNITKFLNYRYSFLPYNYSLSYEYTVSGTPMARPLHFYESQYNRDLVSVIDEYLWGKDMLIAPVVEVNASSREIIFPEGRWVDMNNLSGQLKVYTEGTKVQYDAPLGTLPHFARLGSFITRYMPEKYTSTENIEYDKLRIDYFHNPDADTESFLYEDDRKSVDPISTGNYLRTRLYAKRDYQGGLQLGIEPLTAGYEGMALTHTYEITIHNFEFDSANEASWFHGLFGAGARRRTDSKYDSGATEGALAKKNSKEEVQSITEGQAYYYDSGSHKLHVKAIVPTTTHLGISFSKSNIAVGVEEISEESLHLGYIAGKLSYAVPASSTEASIDIYSATGCRMASISDLTVDGTVRETAVNLAKGIYIARLNCKAADGSIVSRTMKFFAD